jgi:hypothetical protein
MGGEKCNVAIWMMYNLRVKVNVVNAHCSSHMLILGPSGDCVSGCIHSGYLIMLFPDLLL